MTVMPPCYRCRAPWAEHIDGRCPYTLAQRPEDHSFRTLMISLAVVGLFIVLAYLGYHEWWVSTHCTMVLGTQVCQS